MHEVSICQNIVDIACQQALNDGARRVLAVRIKVGALSQVDARAVAFCFEAAARGTLAEAAVLTIETPAGRARCLACAAEFPVEHFGQPCTACASYRWMLVEGDELRVMDLEIA